MENKKLLLGVILFGWTVLTILILTFAMPVSKKIQRKIIAAVRKKRNVEIVKLEDVNVNLREMYLSNQRYVVKYDVYPSDAKELDLEFVALDKNIKVEKTDKNGMIYIEALDKNTMLYTSTFTIVSKNHNFKKVVEVNFGRKYPDGIEFNFINKFNELSNQLTTNVNIPFFTTYNILGESSENQVEIDYDDSYLKKISNNEYLPIKEGKTTIVATTINGKTSAIDVDILENDSSVEYINAIKLIDLGNRCEVNSESEFVVGSTYGIELYQDDKKVVTNYRIESENPQKVRVNRYDQINFASPGITKIKVTLPNGFEYIKELKTKNHLELPHIAEPQLNENNTLELLNGNEVNFTFNFPENSTYHKYSLDYDRSMLYIAFDKAGNVARITPLKVGNTKITLKINDGYEQLVGDYEVVVLDNPYDLRKEKNKISVFVNKFGHMIFFIIEATLSIFFLKCFKVNNFVLRYILFIVIHLSIGLFLASITEYIQTFMPNRRGCIEDATLDMIFYMATSIIILITIEIIKFIKYKKGVAYEHN